MTSLEEQTERKPIFWFLHLRSAPEAVYDMLATDEGRARFWAETAVAHIGVDGSESGH